MRLLLEASGVIEPAAAAMAASRSSAADLAAFEAGYPGMAANLSGGLAACCKVNLPFTPVIQTSGKLVFRHLIVTHKRRPKASFHLSTS